MTKEAIESLEMLFESYFWCGALELYLGREEYKKLEIKANKYNNLKICLVQRENYIGLGFSKEDMLKFGRQVMAKDYTLNKTSITKEYNAKPIFSYFFRELFIKMIYTELKYYDKNKYDI